MYFPSETRFWQHSQAIEGLFRLLGVWPHGKGLSTYSSRGQEVGCEMQSSSQTCWLWSQMLGQGSIPGSFRKNPHLENRNLKIFQFEILKTLP